MSEIPNTTDVLLSEFAQDEDMVELVEMFVAELPDKIASIEKALAESDLTTLNQLAHQLKGAAGGYGFPSITDTAKQVEDMTKADADMEKLSSTIEELASLCSRARAS